MKITLLKGPTDEEWIEVKDRALVTGGKRTVNPPDSKWKHRILKARHSPIRKLVYSFRLEDVPSWVSVHLVRHHVGCQPYVKSQRNDRQDKYDRNTAPQNAPVDMIWDLNVEALMTVANKRLCMTASPETRQVVQEMCRLAEEHTPELKGLLVPMCVRLHGYCEEMYPCGRYPEA